MSVGWFSNDKVPDEPRLVSGEPEFGGRPWLLGRPTPRQLPADYQRPVFKIPELSADDPHRFLSVVQFARDLIDYLVETYDVQRRDERRFVHLMPSQGAGLRFKLTEAGEACGVVVKAGQFARRYHPSDYWDEEPQQNIDGMETFVFAVVQGDFAEWLYEDEWTVYEGTFLGPGLIDVRGGEIGRKRWPKVVARMQDVPDRYLPWPRRSNP